MADTHRVFQTIKLFGDIMVSVAAAHQGLVQLLTVTPIPISSINLTQPLMNQSGRTQSLFARIKMADGRHSVPIKFMSDAAMDQLKRKDPMELGENRIQHWLLVPFLLKYCGDKCDRKCPPATILYFFSVAHYTEMGTIL